MGNDGKTQKIKELSKKKAIERQAEVLKEIRTMMKKGKKISFYSVSQATGASRSYLYNNPVIAETIYAAREEQTTIKRTKESEKTIIKTLKLENKKLREQVDELIKQNGNSYKAKYEALQEENRELKEQLKKAYTIW